METMAAMCMRTMCSDAWEELIRIKIYALFVAAIRFQMSKETQADEGFMDAMLGSSWIFFDSLVRQAIHSTQLSK